MNCNDFELLLADALGDELNDSDRPAFEQHLSECPRCRADYHSAMAAVARLRSLSGGGPAEVESKVRPTPARRSRWSGAALRYAASIIIAFTAGYGVSGLGHEGERTGSSPSVPSVGTLGEPQLASSSFGAAFADTYRTRPGGSELSRCLTAMFSKRN